MRYEHGPRHERKRTSVAYYDDVVRVVGVSTLPKPGEPVAESRALLVATSTAWRAQVPRTLVREFDAQVHQGIAKKLLRSSLPPICTEHVTLHDYPAYVFAVGAALDGFVSPREIEEQRVVANSRCIHGLYGAPQARGTYMTLFWTDRNSVDHYMVVTSRTQIGEVVSHIVQHGFAVHTLRQYESDLETDLEKNLPSVQHSGSPLLVSGPLAYALARAELCFHRATNAPDELYVDQRPPQHAFSA